MELKRYERIGVILAAVITAGSNASAFVCISTARTPAASFLLPRASQSITLDNDRTNTTPPHRHDEAKPLFPHRRLRLYAEDSKQPSRSKRKQTETFATPRRAPYNKSFASSSSSSSSALLTSNKDNEHRRFNQEITSCQTAQELLKKLQSTQALTKIACGGHFNSVNFSTLLHRLGRFSSSPSSSSFSSTNKNSNNSPGSVRATVLVDARFALFLAGLAEALVMNPDDGDDDDQTKNQPYIFFGSRELSNIAWAIAKLKIAPPTSAMPYLNEKKNDDEEDASPQTCVLATCQTIRQQVLEYASQRQQQQQQQDSVETATQQPWIPSVSRVAGYILDVISHRLLHHVDGNHHNDDNIMINNKINHKKNNPSSYNYNFQLQEYANLLWSWATASRVNEAVFHTVISQMIAKLRRQLQEYEKQASSNVLPDRTRPGSSSSTSSSLSPLRPQEWSNSIWAAATAQVYSAELLEFVASLLALEIPSISNPRSTTTTTHHHQRQQLKPFVDDFKPQELANTAWGVATMLSTASTTSTTTTGSSYLEKTSTTASALMTTTTNTFTCSGPVGAAALEILRQVARSACQRADEFKTQELSNTLWALATLGLGLKPSSDAALNNYVVLESQSPEDDFVLMHQASTAILKAALQKISKFRSQELNNLAWSLARLMDPERARENPLLHQVLQSIGEQLSDRKRLVTSQDIGTTLWSLATLEFAANDHETRQRIYRGLVSQLTPEKVRRSKPQELSNALWALTTAEIKVADQDGFDTTLVPATIRPPIRDQVTAVFGMAAQELMRRPHEFKPQEMKDVLWSFSKTGIRHPGLFQATARHLVGSDDDYDAASGATTTRRARGLDGFSPQGLGNLAWSFASQAQLACEIQERYPGNSNLLQCNGRLAVYLASYFDVGELLIQRLFRAIATAGLEQHDNLRKLKPQDLSNISWTFAVLGLSYAAFMETGMHEFRQRVSRFMKGETGAMNHFKGQEIANLLWSLATLNFPVGDLLEYVTPYVELICQNDKGRITTSSIARIFKRQELANIAWSCAVFGKYPKNLMKLLYNGLVGTGKKQDPSLLAEVHKDGGLQYQAITSLIYVQVAMDLERQSGSLRLPPEFPEGWPQPTLGEQNKDGLAGTTESLLELNLSTSKIQRSVSAAFTRIGFHHVEEHVITMEELSQQGVNGAWKPLEILSIDIANLEDKIAIEVDGPAHFIADIDQIRNEIGGFSKLISGKLEYQFRWDGVGHRDNGPTALKQRLLSQLGWRVINLPFWEWYVMCGDEVAENDYCLRLLK